MLISQEPSMKHNGFVHNDKHFASVTSVNYSLNRFIWLEVNY